MLQDLPRGFGLPCLICTLWSCVCPLNPANVWSVFERSHYKLTSLISALFLHGATIEFFDFFPHENGETIDIHETTPIFPHLFPYLWGCISKNYPLASKKPTELWTKFRASWRSHDVSGLEVPRASNMRRCGL